jgi:hypothetical protein
VACLLFAFGSGTSLVQALRERGVASSGEQVMVTLRAGPGGKRQRAFVAFAKPVIFCGLIGEPHATSFPLLTAIMGLPG